eukprot:gene45644-56871_t
MAIIATLMTIALPRYFASLEASKETTLHQSLSVMREALDHYYGDTGRYPDSVEQLVEKRYLRNLPMDPIAERIRSLGHVAPGSYAEFGKLATVPDAPAKPPKALDMVRVLVEGHEAVARTARSLFPVADKASDEPTADLLTQRLTVHEQTAWMLRSLLEE